jgi:hypothetical protein
MALNYEPCSSGCGLSGYFPNTVECIPNQRKGCLDEGCEALSCSKKLANHIGAMKLFICHDNLTRAAA